MLLCSALLKLSLPFFSTINNCELKYVRILTNHFPPSLLILEDGSVLVGYRGTKCCCDDIIGTWGMCGEHEYEAASYLRLAKICMKSIRHKINKRRISIEPAAKAANSQLALK